MQDETSEHQESSRKSRFGVRSITIWQRKFQRSLVFRQANIEKTLKNRGKGMEITSGRTGVNVSKAKLQGKITKD